MNLPTMPISAAMVPDESDSSLVLAMLNERVKLGEDFSSKGNDVTPQGGAILDALGVKLNGSTGYLYCSCPNFRSTDSLGTIAAWVKPQASAGTYTIFASSSEAVDSFYISFRTRSGNDSLEFVSRAGGATFTAYADLALVIGAWNYVVVVSTGTAYLFYVNGQLAATSGTDDGNWFADIANRVNFTVGALRRTTVGNYLASHVASVGVYNEAKALKWISGRYEMAVPA